MKRPRRGRRPLPRRLGGAVAFVLMLVLLLAGAREAGWLMPASGRFTAVDGDSLRRDGQDYRLHAIDAPELDQHCKRATGEDYACGREARQALRGLTEARTLDCRILETDRYGRLVAECLAGDLSINREMVRMGWALAYRRHSRQHAEAESQAREARRGLWQGRFERPESWRQRHRQQARPLRSGMDPAGEPADDD
ncbi:thermonuclease family protein [Aestuariivirga sp.]|uniref:thermonuclease family protein n=1 Tax=Aestuariivirga sp. TaxID=2650926 RepID=UPI00391D6DE4